MNNSIEEQEDARASAPPVQSSPAFERLPTRASLLQRLKNWEDGASWAEFSQLYGRLIVNTARKAGLTDAEAEDVLQETLVSVARNIGNFEVGAQHGSFKGWLLKLARWRITDELRKRPPGMSHRLRAPGETAHTSTTDRLPDPASLDLDAIWEADWEQNLMTIALERVKRHADPAHYQMFQLHVLQQWPAQRVVQSLRVKLSQVYFAKYKITHLLRQEVRSLKAELF